MEWILLGALIVTFAAGIVVLMLVMFLFPITRWIILGSAVSAVVATLFFIGVKTTIWIPAGVGAGIVGVLLLFPPFVWFILAPSNRFFTFVEEGTVKIIMKAGRFERALIQWKGHTFDRWNPDEIGRWNVRDEDAEHKELHHPFGGLRFYGFWPLMDIYIYTFKWTGVAEDGKVDPHPKETLDYILVEDDVYWFELVRAEDKNLLPLRVEVLLTVRVVNPFRALFNIQNWLEAITNRTRPLVRDAMTTDSYENLIKQQERLGLTIMKRLEEGAILEPEFKDRYGIEVRKTEIKEIDPPDEYREITLKKYIAERQREEVVTLADAEAKRIEAVYSQIQKFGDIGQLVRALEAIEKSPLAASLTVQAIPGIQEILRGVFGRPVETVTSEEIRELREMIEKLQKKGKKVSTTGG